MEHPSTLPNWYQDFRRLAFTPAHSIESEEERRRVQMVIALTGFHLVLICMAGLRFLLDGELPLPVLMQFTLNAAILALMYVRSYKAGIGLLITGLVVANFFGLLFSDLTNMMYSVTAFVAVSVLLKKQYRMPYALAMIGIALLAGYLTANNPHYASVTHENVVMFAIMGMLSVVISTSVVDGDLSQIREQVRSLSASEARYRQMFDNNRAIKLVIDPDTGRIKDANAAALAFYGYSRDELKSLCIEDISATHDNQILTQLNEAHTQQSAFFEAHHRLASGELRYVDIFCTPLDTPEGRALYAIVVDATTKREAELRYRSLFEQSNDAVFILDLKGKHLQVSQSAAGMFAYQLEEFMSMSYHDLVVPDQQNQSDNVLERLLAGEKVPPYARTFRRKDGSILLTEINVEVVRNADGDPIHIQSIVRDITERNRIETALRRGEAQLSEAQQISHLGSWHLEMNSNLIIWSNELYRIFGIHPEDFGGTYEAYLDLVHPADRTLLDQLVQTAFQNYQPYSLDYRISHPDQGERILHGMGHVVVDEGGAVQYMVGTAQDITELKRTEEALSVRNKYLTTLHQMSLDLLNRRQTNDLLKVLVNDATSILDTPYGEIILKEGDDLVVRAYTDNQPFLAGDRVDRSEGLLSWEAYDTLQPVIVDNYTLWRAKRDIYDGLQLRAVANFPIRIGEACIGVLGVARIVDDYPFTDEQILIGKQLSELAALVVDNANQYNAALQEIVERKKTEERLYGLTKQLETKSQIEREQRVLAETLRDTAAALNSTLNLDEIFWLILENIKRIIPHDASNIMLIENGIAHVVQHNGWPTEKVERLAGKEFPVQQTAHLNLMYQTHQSCIIDDVKNLDGWHEIAGHYDPLSYLAAPICIGDEVVGFLNLDSMTQDHFTPDHAHRLQAFVSHAAVALKNANLYKQSQTIAALEERQRLARDLHDSVTQTLFASSVIANAIHKQWQEDNASIGDDLLELRDLAQGALAEMRTMLLELRPNALLEVNISDLLGQLVETLKGRARLDVQFETSGSSILPPNVQITLFRVAQEALNNVIKHARATHLFIQLICSHNRVELCIRDDGRGFDLARQTQHRFGLKIMEERAIEAGIMLSIITRPKHGVTLKATWEGRADS